MLLHFFEQLSQSVGRYWKKYSKPNEWTLPSSSDQELPTQGPQKNHTGLKKILFTQGLRWYPFFVLVVFVVSYFWDFTTQEIILLNSSYSLGHLLRILSVSGLIGYATNWLAITMLFKPVHKRPILGQGLIPRQKNRIADRLAKTISSELLHPELISEYVHRSAFIQYYRELWVLRSKNILSDKSFRSEVQQIMLELVVRILNKDEFRMSIASTIESEVNRKVENRTLDRIALKTYTIIKGANVQEIVNEALMDLPVELERQIEQLDGLFDKLPALIDEHVEAIETQITHWIHELINRLDIYQFIAQHLKEYDESKIEALIRTSTNEELRYIQQLGAVIGTIGGLVIWNPVFSMISIAILLLSLYLLDMLLYKTQK